MARANQNNNEDFATAVGHETQPWFTAQVHTPERTLHTRLLVRWLPAEVHAPQRDEQ
jgi:hypothetical protein